MPRGPKGEKRPADPGNAVIIAKIATGEIDDITTEDGKNAAAVALGRMGGKARVAGMSARKRMEIAKKVAEKRCNNKWLHFIENIYWNNFLDFFPFWPILRGHQG
jgi:hypothetical protein